MDAIPVPHMQKLLERIAKKKGYRKPRYEVSDATKVGDNYVGLLYRVAVSEQDDAEDAEPAVSLVFKGMPVSEKRREAMRAVTFFTNEINVYKIVLPAFARLLAEKGLLDDDKPFPNTPRCYETVTEAAEGEDALVLEDMRPLRFTMHDRRVGLDEKHCLVVLHALARMHAASFAMEAQRPDEFAKLRSALKENLFTSSHPFAEHFGPLSARVFQFIAKRFPEGSDGHKKVKDFVDHYFNNMTDLVQSDPNGYNAVTHGDCWTNNLLFKYSESGAVLGVCMLDFQLSRYASPMLDVLYLLYTCTVRAMRDRHADRLLRDYHERLSEEIRALGADPERLYPWDRMQAQLRTYGRYGLGMAIMTVPLFLADVDEIPDLDEAFETDQDVSEVFNVETRSANERDTRISDVVEDLIDRGWM